MPTYDYKCQSCGHTFEHFQAMSDEPLKTCPECGGELKRLIGGGLGVIFKGSGFYVTDNRTGGSGGRKSASASAAPSSESSGTSGNSGNSNSGGSGASNSSGSDAKTGSGDKSEKKSGTAVKDK